MISFIISLVSFIVVLISNYLVLSGTVVGDSATVLIFIICMNLAIEGFLIIINTVVGSSEHFLTSKSKLERTNLIDFLRALGYRYEIEFDEPLELRLVTKNSQEMVYIKEHKVLDLYHVTGLVYLNEPDTMVALDKDSLFERLAKYKLSPGKFKVYSKVLEEGDFCE